MPIKQNQTVRILVIQFSSEFKLAMKLHSKMLISELNELIEHYKYLHHHHCPKNSQFIRLACIQTPQIDYILSLPTITLQFLPQNCPLKVLYGKTNNFRKVIQYDDNSQIKSFKVVRSLSVNQPIYYLKEFSKLAIENHQDFEQIMIIRQFLINHSDLEFIPNLMHTFESQHYYNLLLQYRPFISLKGFCKNEQNLIFYFRKIIVILIYLTSFQLQTKLNILNIQDFYLNFDGKIQMTNLKIFSLWNKQSIEIKLNKKQINHLSLNILFGLMSISFSKSLNLNQQKFQQNILSNQLRNFITDLLSETIIDFKDILQKPWLNQGSEKKFNFMNLILQNYQMKKQNSIAQNMQNPLLDNFIPINNFFDWSILTLSFKSQELIDMSTIKKPKQLKNNYNQTKKNQKNRSKLNKRNFTKKK